MPTFKLHKLVRDKLKAEYERTGQKATYIELTPDEYKTQLVKKIIEEISEVKIGDPVEEITNEIADAMQAVEDFIVACGTTAEKVRYAQQVRNSLKGGFGAGYFVETIELDNSDPWVEYYRQRPDIFPELK
jgi:predicted house-cleaning noncanonical NTP pyrophosphatase (MazG superfamily)